MLLLLHILCLALFLLLGILFSKGKCAGLIAGYHTASPAEKEKIDETALCRFVGRLMFALSGCWCLVVVSDFVEAALLLWLGLGLFCLTALAGVLYANTGKRFQR